MRHRYLLPLLLAGCTASAPPQPDVKTENVRASMGHQAAIDLTRDQVVNSAEFTSPRDQVWAALVAVHEAIEIPYTSGSADDVAVFTVYDKTRTIAGRSASSYVDCGTGPVGQRADSYRVTIKVTHLLESTPTGGTILKTTLDTHARSPGMSNNPVGCSSKGTLEKQIAGMVALRVK